MKKFLLVITLVGVVISQIFFSSLAEAYSEGDEIHVCWLECADCNRKAITVYLINGGIIRDDTDIKVSGYCPRYNYDIEHRWFQIKARYYIYRNGQWVEE